MLHFQKLTCLVFCYEAALVSMVVLRDVALVGGAVYKRASILEWKVRLAIRFCNSNLQLFFCLYYFVEHFLQWRSWFEFFNLDGTRPQKVEPLFISKV